MAPHTFTYEIQLELIQNYSVLVFVGPAIAVFSVSHIYFTCHTSFSIPNILFIFLALQ